MPRVTSYGLTDARAAGGKLALIRLTSRGKEILDTDVVGIFDNIGDAVDAVYNYAHARWYVREPREGAGQEDT